MTDDNHANYAPQFLPGDKVYCISTDGMFGRDGEFPFLDGPEIAEVGLVGEQHYTVHKYNVIQCKHTLELVEKTAPWGRMIHYQYYASRFRKEALPALPEPTWSLDDLELARMEIEEISHD